MPDGVADLTAVERGGAGTGSGRGARHGLDLHRRVRARRGRPARRPAGHHPLGLRRAGSGRLFPQVRLDPDVLFVDDGDVLTSAGVAAGVDLCLHIVRRDHGSEVANRAARRCVVPPWRDGGQAQFIERTTARAGAVIDRAPPGIGPCGTGRRAGRPGRDGPATPG